MFQLDEDFLISLGLGAMPEEEKEAFMAFILEQLELRVGTELSKDMSDEKLEQFEKLAKAKDQAGATAWLKQHCPNYKEVVKQELEVIKQEIIAGRDKLLAPEA